MAGVKPPRGTGAPKATVAVAAAASASAEPRLAKRPAIEVVGPRAGRRRAGRQFDKSPVTIAIDAFEDGALDAIRSDPMLTVTDVEIEG